jgi:hypothetical protein
MFNYNKLYKPYTKNGATLSGTYEWLKSKENGLSEPIAEMAFNEIMEEVARGVDYTTPCPCGCGDKDVHTHLEHAMLARGNAIKAIEKEAATKVLMEREARRVESRMRTLRSADKTMIKAAKKPLSERSPVLRFLKGLVNGF